MASPVAGGAGRATVTEPPFLQYPALSAALRPQLFKAALIWNVGGKFKLKDNTAGTENG